AGEVLTDTIWPGVEVAVLQAETWGDGGRRLLASPQLRWLTQLGLAEQCPDEALYLLAASPHLGQLRFVWVHKGDFGADSLRAFLRSPHLARLERLALGWGEGAEE